MLQSPTLAGDGDILIGAAAIATVLYGSAAARRRVYYLADKRGLPIFRLGATICARVTTLRAWIEGQEGEVR